MVDDALDCLGKQIEGKISASTNILCDLNSVQPEVQQDEDLLSAAHLKKKEVQQKNSKRHITWLDKTRKYTKKMPNTSSVCCLKFLQYFIQIQYYLLNNKVGCFCRVKV